MDKCPTCGSIEPQRRIFYRTEEPTKAITCTDPFHNVVTMQEPAMVMIAPPGTPLNSDQWETIGFTKEPISMSFTTDAQVPEGIGIVDPFRKELPPLNYEDTELNPNDPFEFAIIKIVAMNRRKRRDYAVDSDPFSNFRNTAARMGIDGFGPRESALFNVVQKIARLESLRQNGRMDDPANESVEDTFLDLAVYAVITYALSQEGK